MGKNKRKRLLLPMKTLSGGNIPARQNIASEESDKTQQTKTLNYLEFSFFVVLDAHARNTAKGGKTLQASSLK